VLWANISWRLKWFHYVWSLVNNQLGAQFYMYVYFYSLHVSGSHVPIIRRIIVLMRHLVYVTLCRWPSGMQQHMLGCLQGSYKDARSTKYKIHYVCLVPVNKGNTTVRDFRKYPSNGTPIHGRGLDSYIVTLDVLLHICFKQIGKKIFMSFQFSILVFLRFKNCPNYTMLISRKITW